MLSPALPRCSCRPCPRAAHPPRPPLRWRTPVLPMSPASSGAAAASSPPPVPRLRKLWSDGNAVTRLLMAVACIPACLRTPMASYITCHDIAVESAFSRRLSRVTGEGADGNGKKRKGVDGGRTHHESEHERRGERGVPESRLARCACGQRGDQGRVRRREPAASHHERSLESPRNGPRAERLEHLRHHYRDERGDEADVVAQCGPSAPEGNVTRHLRDLPSTPRDVARVTRWAR